MMKAQRPNRSPCFFRGLLPLLLFLAILPARGAQLRFGQSAYTVGLGGTVEVQVLLDTDEAPGDQMPAGGIFSMGVEITFEPGGAVVSDTNDLALPAGLDGNGIGGPAIKGLQSDCAGAAGAVGFVATTGHDDPVILTVSITGASAGTHTLGLGLLFDSPQANFVEYDTGHMLDEEITDFGSATVTVTAGDMEIRSIDPTAPDQVRFVFEDGGSGTQTYSVKTAPILGTPTAWTVDPAATVTPLGGGMFQVDADFVGPVQQYYQVQGNL